MNSTDRVIDHRVQQLAPSHRLTHHHGLPVVQRWAAERVGFNAMLVGSGMNGVAGKVPGNKSLAIGRNLGCMRYER